MFFKPDFIGRKQHLKSF